MKLRLKALRAPAAAILVLALAALACGGGAPTQPPPTQPPAATQAPPPTAPPPTQPPSPTQTSAPAGELAVVNFMAFEDTFGYFHVVGLVANATERIMADIELTIEIRDASGRSLLKDFDGNPTETDTFSPFLYTLAPGESSPFDYAISPDDGRPETYAVAVTGHQTGAATRADVEIAKAQLNFDGSSSLYLTGELVNRSNLPAQINNLAGAGLDQTGQVITANGYGAVSRVLAPAGDAAGNDRTPFSVRLDYPGKDPANWQVYLDADTTEAVEFYPVAVNVTHFYFDTFDSFHLVGEVVNESDQVLNIGLVAGLYAADGRVLDADTLSSAIYLEPNSTVPFDFQFFSNVNSNPELADEVDSYTVQVDPYWTYATSFEVVALETSNDANDDQGDGQWFFTGDVVNSSNKELSSATVIIGIYDPQGKLVATNWTGIYPEGEAIAGGSKSSFDMTLYIDPRADTAGYQFRTWVQGYVR